MVPPSLPPRSLEWKGESMRLSRWFSTLFSGRSLKALVLLAFFAALAPLLQDSHSPGTSPCGTAPALCGIVTAAPMDEAEGIEVSRGEKTLNLTSDGRELLTYRYRPGPYKAYVKTLRTPSGVNVLLDSPHDHTHHHALMYALQVGDTSFWHEFEDRDPGTQKHDSLKPMEDASGFTHKLDWVSADGELLAEERRTVRVLREVDGDARLLHWRTRLALPVGTESATLTGHHYYGLGMRFVRSMDGKCKFFNPTGKPGKVFRGDERLVRADWCACTGKIDGHPVSVAIFDHPDNPRHPATWFTMAKPFAYLAATLNLHEEPMELQQDRPLDVAYGVALWDGKVTADEVQKTYRNWLEQIEKMAQSSKASD